MTVAIGIIVTGVVGALSMVSGSVSASKESQTRVVAVGLAREGIEAVRVIRDSNWLAARVWDDGLVGILSDRTGVPVIDPATGLWTVDFTTNDISDEEAVVARGGGGGSPNLFRQGGVAGEPTIYRRLVALAPICWNEVTLSERVIAAPETECQALEREAGAEVKSRVRWAVSGRPHNIEIVERIYDWR